MTVAKAARQQVTLGQLQATRASRCSHMGCFPRSVTIIRASSFCKTRTTALGISVNDHQSERPHWEYP
eukprot:533011-Pyramimonas_sp.AAC.1